MSKKRVEFRTYDGVLLRGDYFPVEEDHSPIVVMTQGVTLLKECYIDDIALRFQQAGIAALIYDHRGWGSSEGTPFQEVNPLQQAEDYHDAVTYVRTLAPAIDPSRVAIWGIGHSGGASMIAAGDDPRIKATILVMPWTSGQKDAESFPPNILQAALTEREERVNQPNSRRKYIPVWDNSLEQARSDLPINPEPITTNTNTDTDTDIELTLTTPWLHGEQFYNFITAATSRSHAASTPWTNLMTLQSVYHISRVEPRDWLHKITYPRSLLYIAAATDALTGSLEYHKKNVFARSKNPNARFVQTGKSHLDNYSGGFEECVRVQVEFLTERL